MAFSSRSLLRSASSLALVSIACLATVPARGGPGCVPDLTQAEAIAWVLGGSPADSVLVFSYPYALCPSDSLRPFRATEEDTVARGGADIPISRPSWLFFQDENPQAEYSHKTTFILVSRENGVIVDERYAEEWWPVVNGADQYDEPDVNKTLPDLVWGAYPPDACPAAAPFQGQGPVVADAPDRSAAKLGAYLLKGRHYTPNKHNNARVMKDALKDAGRGPGVPVGNIDERDMVDLQTIKDVVDAANAADYTQVYIYIVAHGNKTEIEGTSKDIKATDLTNELKRLKACSVFVFIQACKSGAWFGNLYDKLALRDQELLPHDPSRVGVFTSADRDKESETVTEAERRDDLISYWTRDLAKAFTLAAADANNDGKVSPKEATDYVFENGCADTKKAKPRRAEGPMSCPQPTNVESTTWGTLKARYGE